MDTYNNKSLMVALQKHEDVLRPLNNKALDSFSNNAMSSALDSLAKAVKLTKSIELASPKIQEAIQSVTKSYNALIDASRICNSFSEALKPAITNLHVDTIIRLSQFPKTDMIRDLGTCFANAQYDKLADVFNNTMACPKMAASDVAFIKTTELAKTLKNSLSFPRGFSKALRDLNVSTAEEIFDNNDLEYDTKGNEFLSKEGTIDAKGLNIICSGEYLFSTLSGEVFTEAELIDFISILSNTPMRGAVANTGQKIYEFLKRLSLSGDRTIGFDHSVFYHCRSHKPNDMPYTFEQMLQAPHGLPWAGRYNHVGRSCYYFSDTQYGAETEVKRHQTDDVLQTIRLKPTKEIRLLDLSNTLSRGKVFLRYLRFKLSDVTDKMPREYLLPCYVADCCKEIGFDGIKYYGSKEYSNYVSWNDGYFDYDGICCE